MTTIAKFKRRARHMTVGGGGGGGGSVTSANVYFHNTTRTNNLGGSIVRQMLMRAGTSYQLTVKDQAGNVLDGTVGTWEAIDYDTQAASTKAPIGSTSGLATPNAVCGVKYIYTHTATGVQAICEATVIGAATPLVEEAFDYADDAAFRNNIRNSVTTGYATPAPTGGAGALYQDGLSEGYITLDSSRPFMDMKTGRVTFNSGFSGTIALRAKHTGITRGWIVTVNRHEPGFNCGSYNGSSAGSYKDGPFWNQAGAIGRYDLAYSNGDNIGANLYCQLLVQSGGSGMSGMSDQTVQQDIPETRTQWSSGDFYLTIIQYEARIGLWEMWSRMVRVRLGENPLTKNRFDNVGPATGKTIVGGACQSGYPAFIMDTISPFGENMNNAVASTIFKNQAYWEVVDGTSVADPLGFGGDTSAPTISSISGGALTIGGTNQVITINGSGFNEHCQPVFSNSAIRAHFAALNTPAIVVVSPTQMTVAVDVPAGTAADAAGTITIKNLTSGNSSGTAAVTIS
jgi:hypothetical protein